jgi:flagellar hook-length control protein FliK
MQSSMTTVQNSTVNATQHGKKPEKSGRSAVHGDAGSDQAEAFAGMFGDLMALQGGQNFAASIAAEGKALPATSGLASEILGPSVHIITSTAPATSDDSLLAFARAQGMDETSLALIFGKHALAEAEAQAQAQTLPKSGSLDLGAAKLGDLNSFGSAEKSEAGNLLDLGPEGSLRWSLGQATSLTPKDSSQALFGLNGMRSFMPVETASSKATPDMATSAQDPNQSLAASLIMGAGEASQMARRAQMRQSTQRSEKLDAALGLSDGKLVTVSKSDSEPSTAIETLVLDMSGISESDTHSLGQQGQSEHRQPNSPAQGHTQSISAAPKAEHSQLEMRAEQYQRLSDRLAEALGQRLSAQFAKGDWKVDMALHPAELGNIQIELKMNGGSLEANFSASAAGTQALIADGLPKLKEILAQLGMDVASMNVNVGQQGQNGGNPTPQPQASRVQGVTGKADAKISAEANLSPTRASGISDDGLDVLA